MNAGMFSAGIGQNQSSIVSNVVIGHIELLELFVLLEPLSQIQGSLIPQASVHQGQEGQRLVLWQGLQQDVGSGLQQRVVTQSAGHIR